MGCENEFGDNLLKQDMHDAKAVKYAEGIRNKNDVIIWGSGSGADALYRFLKEFQSLRGVKYYADNQKERWGTFINGYPVLSPEEAVEKAKEKEVCIIIASMGYPTIRRQLLSLGVENKMIDITGFTVANDYYTYQNETAYQIIESHYNEFEQVYFCLADDRSKKIYLNILNSKISLDNKYLKGISSSPQQQYFDKELLKLGKDEIFCDCGSYNGDTLETFFQLTGGSYRSYIAIEADKDIYSELKKKIADRGYKNVVAHNIACWDKKTVLKFQSAKSAGHITDQGEREVPADTLDHILKDQPVTMIKMDIEGAEEAALTGAGDLIRKNKPVLCICIYHSLKDFYKIPLIMKELNREYHLFIRNYTDMVAVETVCYAIPADRLQIINQGGIQ